MLLSYILGAGLVVNVCIIASASCKRASGRGCEWARVRVGEGASGRGCEWARVRVGEGASGRVALYVF